MTETDKRLAAWIGMWLVWSMKTERPETEEDTRLVSVLAKIIYENDAQMICEMLLSEEHLRKQLE